MSDELSQATAADFKADSLDGVDDAPSFPVSDEELLMIGAELATECVASKPYSKNPSVRRPLQYTIDKLLHLLKWREEVGATDVFDLLEMGKAAIGSVKDEEAYEKCLALVNTLNNNSIYVHGFDKVGRPVIWMRTERKPWFLPDVDGEVNLKILMVDAAIKLMPAGVTDVVVVCDTSSVPSPAPTFLFAALKGMVRGYPDRLKALYAAPLGRVLHSVMLMLLPLMPGSLSPKLQLVEQKEEMRAILKDVLRGGEADIPTFFDGPVDHDQYYPSKGIGSGVDVSSLGEGCLMFDFDGMMKRQAVMLAEVEKESEKEQGK